MMTTTTIDVTTIESLTHEEAMLLQARELACTLSSLRSLEDEFWAAPTDCPAWDIRAMYQHVLGACEAGASIRENIHDCATLASIGQAERRAARSCAIDGASERALSP